MKEYARPNQAAVFSCYQRMGSPPCWGRLTVTNRPHYTKSVTADSTQMDGKLELLWANSA